MCGAAWRWISPYKWKFSRWIANEKADRVYSVGAVVLHKKKSTRAIYCTAKSTNCHREAENGQQCRIQAVFPLGGLVDRRLPRCSSRIQRQLGPSYHQ